MKRLLNIQHTCMRLQLKSVTEAELVTHESYESTCYSQVIISAATYNKFSNNSSTSAFFNTTTVITEQQILGKLP